MARRTRLGRARLAWLAAVAFGTVASLPLHAADPCDGFVWNVTHERAVFATPAVSVTAASTAGPAPTLDLDKLYEITLTPQGKVSFVLAPAKKTLADGAFAGMVKLHIRRSGKYRVSMSDGFWIDAIADGKLVATDDFSGAHECRAPRKIVQFLLVAGDVILQFANANSASVRVTVTAAPK